MLRQAAISMDRLRKIRVFIEDTYVSLDYQRQAGELYRKDGDRIKREKIPVQTGEPLANELRSFASCVAHRHEPLVSGQHAADALKLAVDITHRISEQAPAASIS